MKRYPVYRDSGIEWVGEIPKEWTAKKLGYIAKIQGRIGFKGYKKTDLVDEGQGALTLGGKHISNNNQLNLSDPEFISWEKYYESPEIMVSQGDIIVSQRGSLGKALLIDRDIGEATINPSLVLIKDINIDSQLLFYYLTSDYICKNIELLNTTTAVPMISQEQLSSFKILIPPKEHQTTIAKYIDHKTHLLDILIKKKQKQIKLLKEQRTAIINQAVTKGLDSDVKMKDSGIEWLGEIPEHWKLQKISSITNVVRGASPRPAGDPMFFSEEGCPWITVGEITKDTKKYLREVSTFLTDEGMKRSRFLNEGTLVLTNSGATLGVPKILKLSGCINDGSVAFLNLSADVVIDFLYYYFVSLTENYRERIKQGAGQPNLNTNIIKSTDIALCNKDEQQRIVKYLDNRMKISETVIQKIDNQIGLLKEYRTTLISDVVTGKIDVRDEVIS